MKRRQVHKGARTIATPAKRRQTLHSANFSPLMLASFLILRIILIFIINSMVVNPKKNSNDGALGSQAFV
jgi:hypothetical protein